MHLPCGTELPAWCGTDAKGRLSISQTGGNLGKCADQGNASTSGVPWRFAAAQRARARKKAMEPSPRIPFVTASKAITPAPAESPQDPLGELWNKQKPPTRSAKWMSELAQSAPEH
ncbi:MAG: hypothetical protein IPJ18_22715 [Betaproteobacteria bacterium]|nr:hypothetical protein [Betaproteobacteria bacterium]